MALKDWKKGQNKPDIVAFAHKTIKDYNESQPKHLQVGEKYRFSPDNWVTIIKGWHGKDVTEADENKAIWTVRDNIGELNSMSFKSKSEALNYAKKFMRSH